MHGATPPHLRDVHYITLRKPGIRLNLLGQPAFTRMFTVPS